MRFIAVVLLILTISGLSYSANTCQLINTPGTVLTLTGNVSGTTNILLEYGFTGCIVINNTANVILNCNGFAINALNGNLTSAQVSVIGSTNVTVENCVLNVSSSQFAVDIENSSNSVFKNNYVFGQNASSFSDGFESLVYATNDSFINNTVSGTNTGFDLEGLSNLLIANNTVKNIQNTPISTFDSPYRLFVDNTVLSGNTALNCSSPLPNAAFIISGNNDNITNNLAKSNQLLGAFDVSGNSDRLSGNNATNDTYAGFTVDFPSEQMVVTNNIANNDSGAGFYVNAGADQANLSNNLAYNDTDGFDVEGFNQSEGGGYVLATNTTLTNNSAANNTGNGFFVEASDVTTLISNNATGNGYGLLISDSNDTTLSGTHFYNNSIDFIVNSTQQASSSNYTMVNSIFDNPSSSMTNYTNLSINDTVAITDGYTINWTSNSSALPAGYVSFNQTFVNISTINGAPNITSLVWSWTTAEASGYTPATFALYKYNTSGWTNLNNTPDTVGDTLSLYNMTPGSIYGILENANTNCPVITSSGTYTQTSNFTGAPNPLSNAWSGSACVEISASDVVYDCNGHPLNTNGTGGVAFAIGSDAGIQFSNVTVKNCIIDGSGMFVNNITGSSLSNNTIYNGSTGFYVVHGSNDNMSMNNVSTITDGVYLTSQSTKIGFFGNYISNASNGILQDGSVSSCNLSGNTITNTTTAMGFGSLSDSVISGNTFSLITSSAVEETGSSNDNNFTGNTLTNSTGMFDITSSGDLLANNLVANSTGAFLVWGGATVDSLVNNTVYNVSGNGIMAESNCTVANNTVNLSGSDCYYVGVGNYLVNNTAYNCTSDGYALTFNPSVNNSFIANTAYFTVNGFDLDYAAVGNNFTSNRVYNSTNGFYSAFGYNNRYVNNSAINNTDYGFYLYNSTGSYLANNTAQMNRQYDLMVEGNDISACNVTVLNTTGNQNRPILFTTTAVSWSGANVPEAEICGANNSVIAGSTINSTIGSDAFLTFFAYNTSITGSSSSGNLNGFAIQNGGNNVLSGDTANNDSDQAFYISSEGGDNLTSDTASFSPEGFMISGGNNTMFINNTAHDINDSCISFEFVELSSSIINNTAYNCGLHGMQLFASNATVSGGRLYNTGQDLLEADYSGSPIVLNMSGVAFNNTVISINDTLGSDESYSINSTGFESALPNNTVSFAQKIVSISQNSPPTSIDSIAFSWNSSELVGYTQSLLELWEYNSSGWTDLNASLNTSTHTLSMTNLVPHSDYAILQSLGGCQLINAPGIYTLTTNATGTAALTYGNGNTTCILINNTANVTLDCAGYTMNAISGSFESAQVVIQNSKNVTVKNCVLNVSDMDGVVLYNASNSFVQNNSAFTALGTSTSLTAFSDAYVSTNINNSFINNSGLNNSIFLNSGGLSSLYANNTAIDCDWGIIFGGWGNNANATPVRNSTISGNTVIDSNSGSEGLVVNGTGNNITGNLVEGVGQDSGTFVLYGSWNLVAGNTVTNNYENAISIYGDNDLIINNSALDDNNSGFSVTLSQNDTFINNTAAGDGSNYGAGFYIYASNITMSGTHLYNNTQDFDVLGVTSYSTSDFNMTNSIFDNPSGSMANYTNLSINDSVSTGEEYTIKWTSNSSSLPAGKASFAQTFVNISTVSGPVSIDSIVWSWTNAEATGYNQSRFQLWKYDSSGWIDLNSTPDTTGDTLSLHSMNPGSIYGILQDNDTTPPTVNLISPVPGKISNISAMNFSFNTTDDASTVMNCSLYIDGILNQTNGSVNNGTTTVFPVSVIPDGLHLWNVTCKDQSNNLGISATRNFTIDTHAPVVTLNNPSNSTLFNVTTVNLNFTATDNIATSFNCSLILDGVQNITNASVSNGTLTNWQVTGLAQGAHTWLTNCTDTAGNQNTSQTRNFTVDTTPPVVSLNNPINSTFFNVTTVNLNFTATESIPTTMICSLILDGVQNITNASVSNGTLTNWQVTGLAQGAHTWITNCTDQAGNQGISTTRNFTVWTTAPVVQLVSPGEGSTLTSSNVLLNFTAMSNISSTMNCSLYLDGLLNATNSSTANDTATTFNMSDLADGTYNWSVSCTDSALNTGASATQDFIVNTVINHETPTPQPQLPSLSINLDSNCTGNVVSVRSGDSEISGANVMVDDASSLGTLYSGSSDDNGQMGFTGCGLNVRITVEKDGYQTAQINEQTIACGQCFQCSKDTDCPDSDSCVNQKCVPLVCSCGQISDHVCSPYECCSDNDCSSGEVCQGHECRTPVNNTNKTYECTSDANCLGTQFCDIPAGALGGNCKDITGCGSVANHVLTPYQCGSGPNCPSCALGQLCLDNVCKSFGLTGPTSGFIGDNASVQAKEDNAICTGCDLQITDPTGKVLTGKTDASGNFALPLKVTGTYIVAYLKNGTVVRTVDIQSLPRASTPGQTTPTLTILQAAEGTLAALIILALIAAALIIMRRPKGGGFRKKPKE